MYSGSELELDREGERYRFASDRRFEKPDQVLEGEIELLRNIDVNKNSSTLTIDSRLGIEGIVLADRARNGRVMMASSKTSETLTSELNRRKNRPEASVEVMITSDIANDSLRMYDRAVYIPRRGDPIHLVKQKIKEAAEVLRADGILNIALNTETNVELKEYAKTLGKVSETLSRSVSILHVEPGDVKELDDPLKVSKMKHSIKGENVRFQVPKGMFSPEDMREVEMAVRELDDGDGRVLDALKSPGLAAIFCSGLYNMDGVTVNNDDFMRRFAEVNSKINDREIRAKVDEGLEIFDSERFNSIILSTRGENKDRINEYIKQSHRVLDDGGEILVVHEKSQNIESLLREQFSGYKVKRRESDLQVSSAYK